MACCTYLTGNQYTAPTTDRELNNLLAEVRDATGDDWRIREMVTVRKRWWRSPIVKKHYELYSHVSGIEFQSINFYRPDREGAYLPSINLVNEAAIVAAYLYGVLAGLQRA